MLRPMAVQDSGTWQNYVLATYREKKETAKSPDFMNPILSLVYICVNSRHTQRHKAAVAVRQQQQQRGRVTVTPVEM